MPKKPIYFPPFERVCGGCGILLIYSTRDTLRQAILTNSLCKSCGRKKYMQNIECSGVANPFFGKKHTQESKEKMSLSLKGRSSNKGSFTHERTVGNNNPMFGKSFYQVWIVKYGKEEADRLLIEYKIKKSKNYSGKGNPMYGKPSPGGSGNGWKGWYKNVHFRSLHELSYMVLLTKENRKWESAENGKFIIKYLDLTGQERNYFPDFIVDDKLLVEIKPQRLINGSKLVQIKAQAAEIFCKENNLQYLLTDVELLSDEEIAKMHEVGEIKFTERYEQLYQQRLNFINSPKLET